MCFKIALAMSVSFCQVLTNSVVDQAMSLKTLFKTTSVLRLTLATLPKINLSRDLPFCQAPDFNRNPSCLKRNSFLCLVSISNLVYYIYISTLLSGMIYVVYCSLFYPTCQPPCFIFLAIAGFFSLMRSTTSEEMFPLFLC